MRNTDIMRFLLFFLIVLGFTACDPSKRTTDNNRPRPQRPTTPPKKDNTAQTPMDTVRWSPPSPNSAPPIKNNTPTNTTPVDVSRIYKIGLLLPFLSDDFAAAPDEIPNKSDYALHFFSGAKLAFEQLSIEEPQLKMKINVLDSYVSDADFYRVLDKPDLASNDVFIGPIRSSHVSLLGKKMKVYKKPIISPFSPSENLLSDYPNYLQVNPTLNAHLDALLDFALKNHSAAQIVLIGRQKERDRLAYIQQSMAARGLPALREIVEADDATNLSANLTTYISSIRPTVFIVPSWSSEDFVNAVLRDVKSKKRKNEVMVLGMPQWEDFERIEPELFSAGNVHLVNSNWTDLESEAVKKFKATYIEQYGTVPIKYAYDGYDIAYWTGKMIAKHGIDFSEKTNLSPWVGLRTGFRFLPLLKNGVVDYRENRYLFILKYENGQFLPTGIE